MKPIYTFIVFLVLLISSVFASIHSYRMTENDIETDLNRALELTLAQKTEQWITPDTIKCYRSHVSLPVLRDCAYLSYCLPDERRPHISSKQMLWQKNGKKQKFRGYAECSMATIFSISSQSIPMTLASFAIIWVLFSFGIYRHKLQSKLCLTVEGVSFGGINYQESCNEFYNCRHDEIHLTPMQHRLMQMFFSTDNHTLSKEEICNALWPKKDDASVTLYALIKRIRPILESNSSLKIDTERGKNYKLTEK